MEVFARMKQGLSHRLSKVVELIYIYKWHYIRFEEHQLQQASANKSCKKERW